MPWWERYRAHIVGALLLLIVTAGAVLAYRWAAFSGSTEIDILPASPEVAVHVEGRVASPGLYTLQEGARIADAIEAAGGLAPDADLTAVNLAAPVRDGDLIHVYAAGEVPQKVNINTADAWLLQALPGIGEVLAQRIVDYRNENGPFQRLSDLTGVEGIGPSLIVTLEDRATVR